MLTIALVGRPNTGKSTLFNRLTNSRMAIVSSVPGTTRDRRVAVGSLAGLTFNVVDTGGLDDRGAVSVHIQAQVTEAIKGADLILFMLDAKAGVTTLDEHFAKWLRRKIGLLAEDEAAISLQNSAANSSSSSSREQVQPKKQVLVLANKTEGAHLSNRVLDTISETLRLGLGDPILISASHGDGMADLAGAFLRAAAERGLDNSGQENEKEEHLGGKIPFEERTIQLAVMGRPNVGKSTLVNAFVGEQRVITGPTAGLTRDAVHVEWQFNERLFRLVDTAGLTRTKPNKMLLSSSAENKRVALQDSFAPDSAKFVPPSFGAMPPMQLPGIEHMDPEMDPSQFSYQVSELALISALNALRFAQVVLLVVDGEQGKFSKVDLQLARKCLEEGRALVIAANKKDLVSRKGVGSSAYEEGVRKHCEQYLREFGEVPVVACAAIDGVGVKRVLEAVLQAHDAWSKRADTWVLNQWLKDVLVTCPRPRSGGKPIKIKYITQVKSRPPVYALFGNASELPGFFERFLRSKLQHDFSLQGVPLRFTVRKTVGADVDRQKLSQGKHTRRGVGRGEGRGVGPKKRNIPIEIRKLKDSQNIRRRKDTRQRRQRGRN